MTPEEMQEMFGDSDPFSDFFHTFFGGAATGADPRGGRPGRKAPRKGRDFEDEIQLNLEDAYRGATRRLTIKQDGHARSVDVRIPAGVGDGSRVRIPGEGEHGATGAQAGDLYLRIRLAPHAQFDRKGSDLYTRVAVPLTTAVLGGEVEVPTLSGKSLRLKVPTTTQSGQVFRLKGHGMPVVGKPDERGDLYATADVQLPRQLTPEERTHSRRCRGSPTRRRARWHDPSAFVEAHTMNINKFTEKAREAVAKAIELAKQSNNPQVEPEHLLVALVEQPDGIVPELLRKMNVDVAAAGRRCARSAQEHAPGVRRIGAASVAALHAGHRPGPGGGRSRQGRVRQHRASVHRHRRRRRDGRRPPSFSRNRGSRRTPSRRPSRASAARSASPTRTRKARIRRSSATAAI